MDIFDAWNSFQRRDDHLMVSAAEDNIIEKLNNRINSLLETQRRYRQIFNQMLSGYALHEIIFDSRNTPCDYRFIEVNPAFEKLTGLKREGIIGKTILEVLPETERHWIEIYGSVAQTQDPIQFEHYSGALNKYFEITAFSPQPGYFAVIFNDITGRIHMENAIKDSNARMTLALDGTDEGIWDWNVITGEIIYDHNWKRILGYDSEEIRFNADWLRDSLHPESLPVFEKAFKEYLEGGARYFELEYRIKNSGGEWRWIWSRGKCVAHDNSGRPVRLIGTQQDVTDKKRLESQFIQSQKMEAIGRLTSGVSHDFNNLLTSIIGNSELLLQEMSEDNASLPLLKEIIHAGQSAASLIRQLLAFSRKQVLELEVLDLNQEITGLKKMLQRLIGEDIHLITFLAPKIGNIKADRVQIQQVIINLTVNAKDAMPHGGKLSIESANVFLDDEYAHEHGVKVTPGPYAMISISDTGVGMDKETQSKIFEPFFTTKEKGQGTGLGLATVYGIIKQCDGYIWVYSEIGKGTTFKIYMPVIDGKIVAKHEKQIPLGQVQGTGTILLVEDEPSVRHLFSKVLQQYGYTVLEAQNGEEALAVCDDFKKRIHLMITDVVMPGITGTQLADTLKSRVPEMKVLFMSGYSDKTVFGADALNSNIHFIQKPISPRDFVLRVREMVPMDHP